MSQFLLYTESKLDNKVSLEKKLSTPDPSDFGNVVAVDSNCTDKAKKVPSKIPFCAENKKNQFRYVMNTFGYKNQCLNSN